MLKCANLVDLEKFKNAANSYLVAKICADTAENGPSKVEKEDDVEMHYRIKNEARGNGWKRGRGAGAGAGRR